MDRVAGLKVVGDAIDRCPKAAVEDEGEALPRVAVADHLAGGVKAVNADSGPRPVRTTYSSRAFGATRSFSGSPARDTCTFGSRSRGKKAVRSDSSAAATSAKALIDGTVVPLSTCDR